MLRNITTLRSQGVAHRGAETVGDRGAGGQLCGREFGGAGAVFARFTVDRNMRPRFQNTNGVFSSSARHALCPQEAEAYGPTPSL